MEVGLNHCSTKGGIEPLKSFGLTSEPVQKLNFQAQYHKDSRSQKMYSLNREPQDSQAQIGSSSRRLLNLWLRKADPRFLHAMYWTYEESNI